ncbi:MAG: hypothetical protein V3V98_03385 [Thermoplasmata archaeon]
MHEGSPEGLFDEFVEGFESLWTIVEAQYGKDFGSLSVQARKTVAETALFLNEMIQEVGLEEVEKEFVRSWLRQFDHLLGREFEGNFILRFHYFGENYAKDPGPTVHSVISLILALRALETCGTKLTRGGTVWGYLERDMPLFRKALDRIFRERANEYVADELFLLLNTIELLSSMEDSKILTRESEEFMELAGKHQASFDKAFQVSPGLVIYTADLQSRLSLPVKVHDKPSDVRGKPAAFRVLVRLRKGDVPDVQELKRAHHPSAYHLWWIANAWRRRLVGEAFVGILPFYRRLDVDVLSRIVWGDLKQLLEIPATEQEMEVVLALTSKEIKSQLFEYFRKHPYVSDWSRLRLAAERDKADAGGEISDFNVEFGMAKGRLWVAMPIKSGRETMRRDREKVEQDFLYQFVKPLVTFETDEVVVFPIILVHFTLNATEFLSLIRARLQLPIMVMDIEGYTRFLKRENLLAPI